MAIPVPEPYGSELQLWRALLGDPLGLRVPAHITLLPPTRVSRLALGELEAHLYRTGAAHPPFTVVLRGTASFRPVSAVVFVAVRQGAAECERLQRYVRSGPLERPLAFPYHPHVTVAHGLDDERLDAAGRRLADYEVKFTADSFGLYEHGADGFWRLRRRYALDGG
ncbi:2'-5' RNA ligase family protein [Allonocardiopsis opalescens]|uniref:2'-5' RNA ligase n=1 Tax=Allonocardiopsis opalescens TaxID=1144618 RepID=A0A2T0PSI1_9ACTN|nr:2'-5' RNA ligase family protein [Allonocardiopsis opalescens]PRX91852.1 2'-5' RNA ligase [Allonocardiopsis opalescens]